MMAAAVVDLACSHGDRLRQTLREAKGRIGGEVPSNERWALTLAELLRAHFCASSLYTIAFYSDSDLSNLYGGAVLHSLRSFPHPESQFVRQVFSDAEAFDEAIACYVHGKLQPLDRQVLIDSKKLLQLSEDNPMLWFCGKVHVRSCRLLGIEMKSLAFTICWIENSAAIIPLWELFNKWEPVL
jgi:hypothetical protein